MALNLLFEDNLFNWFNPYEKEYASDNLTMNSSKIAYEIAGFVDFELGETGYWIKNSTKLC
jgi:hypothetical protein